ncbi:MAG: hypothetical protein VB100_01930 [Angelakisella sp.]|nr:hypothetical protein [Angelakisella sp.]
MENMYQIDWQQTKHQFDLWWHQQNQNRPLISIKAPKTKGCFQTENDKWVESSGDSTPAKEVSSGATEQDYDSYWLDFDRIMQRNKDVFDHSYFTGETFPRMFANLGVASLAVFLGCKPLFAKDTIWYEYVLNDPESALLKLNNDNPWLKWSLETTKRAKEAAQDNFKVGIPDLCEHMDVLSSLFNTQDLLFHMLDYEDEILRLTQEVQNHWFDVYERHYNIVKEPDGYCCYGPFQLLGQGKTAKLQCDMSAMIGKDMFDQFALPFLRQQTEWLDNSLYHLDGPDALKHLDSVLSLEKLSALQWTPGAGNSDGGDEAWDFIYEKALNAGKSIFALVSPKNIRRFTKRFGHQGIFIMTSAADRQEADEIMALLSST